jgi:hypothetical protein
MFLHRWHVRCRRAGRRCGQFRHRSDKVLGGVARIGQELSTLAWLGGISLAFALITQLLFISRDPPKRNGNMPAVRAPSRGSVSATIRRDESSKTTPGSPGTATRPPTRSGPENPIPGACTTCMAMCLNGAWIQPAAPIRGDRSVIIARLSAVHSGSREVDPGCTAPRQAALPTATATAKPPVAATSAFASSSLPATWTKSRRLSNSANLHEAGV